MSRLSSSGHGLPRQFSMGRPAVPGSRHYALGLSVSKKWRPNACSFVSVSSANPLTAPRISLVTLDGAAERGGAACAMARAVEQCVAVPAAVRGDRPVLPGCKRRPDLIQTVALAMGEAADAARAANGMAQRLQRMLSGAGGGAGVPGLDMAAIARDAAGTLGALNSLSAQLDRSFAPGKGDIARTRSLSSGLKQLTRCTRRSWAN